MDRYPADCGQSRCRGGRSRCHDYLGQRYYIEDYSDLEQQVAEIAHVDLIEQELLDKPRDQVIVHLYLEPSASPVETLAQIAARMEAVGIPYTVETSGVEQEDWQNGWRKYYHPMEIGSRLAVVPSWQQYDTDRVQPTWTRAWPLAPAAMRPPACVWRRWISLCRGASGCWISAPAAHPGHCCPEAGPADAEGVDIDPVAVRTAGENAALNGVIAN